jgi:NAD-dependent deacetylase
VTGAGISADSGLPTYRGIGGLYSNGKTEDGVPIEEALSGAMMEEDPDLPWKYISQIESACRGTCTNRAHEVIAEMEEEFEIWVLTQNIDGFHSQAGSSNIIEIHGCLRNIYCTTCGYNKEVTDYTVFKSYPPRCPDCGGYIRPDVVLFGEMLPEDKLHTLERELSKGFDMVFTIGTTSVFPYIARPVILAKREWNAPVVEINPEDTYVTHLADVKIREGAAKAMEGIWKAFLA